MKNVLNPFTGKLDKVQQESTDTSFGANSDELVPTQKATKAYVTASITAALVGYATQAWVAAQGYITNVITALGYTPENVSNKSTSTSLGTSDTAYPSQKAVKTYVDNGLAAKLGLAGGVMTGPVTQAVVALVDAATIAVDASLGNQFTVTLGGNRALGNPTNATNGQLLIFAIRQDGTGGRTLSFGNKFRFSDEIPNALIASGAGKTSYIGVRYHGSDDKFDVIAFTSNH